VAPDFIWTKLPRRDQYQDVQYNHFSFEFQYNSISKHCFFPPFRVGERKKQRRKKQIRINKREKSKRLYLILFAPTRNVGTNIKTYSATNFHLNFSTILFQSKVIFHPPRWVGGKKKQRRKNKKSSAINP
jgi:hypothetical protein